MYDDFKLVNYSKSLVSPELYGRHLSRLITGEVLDGLTVTPGSGLQVVLAPGNALIPYGSGAVASAREMSLVANFNLTIGTPDVSNPRHDLVVIYVDNGVTLPGGTPSAANLDGKGVVKAKIVSGTPASSPSDPNNTAIQSSVGAGNPYIVVARVRVNAGVSVIAGNLIEDYRKMAEVSDELGRVTLSSASNIIDVPLSSSKRLIQIEVSAQQATSVAVPIMIRFNANTTASNYVRGMAVLSAGGTAWVNTDSNAILVSAASSGDAFSILISGDGKPQTAGSWNGFNVQASSTVETRTGLLRYKGAEDIKSVQIVHTTAGGFAAGSTVSVRGRN